MKKKITDNVFITVGTQKQKALAEKLIGDIGRKYDVNISVIPDDEQGTRIGSGGAVFNIISKHYSSDKRLLIINSGGMSKRSVNYALRGKVFAKIIYKEQTMTLLEAIIINAKRILNSVSSGVIVSCSDILVETDNLNAEFDNNIGFCVRSDLQTGTRHGVMFHNKDGLLSSYPHKTSAENLQGLCEQYKQNGVLIDTGLAVAIPEGHVGIIAVRSSMGIKNGITLTNGIGVIDSDYRGPLRVGLFNLGREAYTVRPADRIAQLMVVPVVCSTGVWNKFFSIFFKRVFL